MRQVVILSLLLLSTGWLACRVEIAPRDDAGRWVRTHDGWEKPVEWARTPVYEPPLHPFIVLLGQALASMLALFAFPPRCPRERSDRGPLVARTARVPHGRHTARPAGRRRIVRETA